MIKAYALTLSHEVKGLNPPKLVGLKKKKKEKKLHSSQSSTFEFSDNFKRDKDFTLSNSFIPSFTFR